MIITRGDFERKQEQWRDMVQSQLWSIDFALLGLLARGREAQVKKKKLERTKTKAKEWSDK